MRITFRRYNHSEDYQRVDDFLIRHYQPGNLDGNWVEPTWEYMHHHPLLDSRSLGKIGIWEAEGEIVAVAHYEWRLGEAARDMAKIFEINLREIRCLAKTIS